MRFGVVGECIEAVFAAEAIHASGDHTIQAACVSGALAVAMTDRGVVYSLVSSAEEAILDPACDALLIAATDVDESMAMVRQASQAGCHVIVVPPEDVSTAYSYELHLLLDESEKGIVPFAGRWYVDDSAMAVGLDSDIQQLTLSLPLDVNDLSARQLRGIDALCGCGFVFSQVTALDVPGANGQLLSRGITLSSSAESETRVPPATLSFTTDAPVAEFDVITAMSVDGEQQRLPTALSAPHEFRDLKFQGRVLERVTGRLTEPDACQRGMEEFSNTLELMEGLQKSLRRRRTVDVHFDGVSERSAFKTQMTAIGCGVLTYLLFGLVAFLVLAKVASLPPWALQVARIVWIAPLVLFLFAQLLLPLARERSSNKDEK